MSNKVFRAEIQMEPLRQYNLATMTHICDNHGFTYLADSNKCVSEESSGQWSPLHVMIELLKTLDTKGYEVRRYGVKRIEQQS